jgi:hypothetical protein
VGEAGSLAQFGDVARSLLGLMGTGDPLELVGTDDAKGHLRSLATASRHAPHLVDLDL